jgi:ADP-ribose pyrophosphatase YjhB (NUDIX family)
MSREIRDSRGKTLADYVRPSVAVDTAVLSVDPDEGLVVLQVHRDTAVGWALPGTFLWEDETLADAVQRCLRTKANIGGLQPRQLHVFDRLGRDNRGWVLSVAHLAVVRADQLADRHPEGTRLAPVNAPGRLAHDHNEIITMAVADLRTRYTDKPDPDHLLGDRFTLRQLRQVHQAVAGEPIGPDKIDTFRRKMKLHLTETQDFDIADSGGRPARLFQRTDR